MKSFCVFREEINSPIFESEYDFRSGLINGVTSDKFQYKVPWEFIDRFELSPDFGSAQYREYYMLALQYTNGLVAFNFYDVGITVISKDSVYVMFLEGFNVNHYLDIGNSGNIFKYPKYPIGLYKTVVRQLDVSQSQCCLYVDDNGRFLHENGTVSVYKRGFSKDLSVEEILSIKGAVTAWRDGYDGVLLDSEKEPFKFKVRGNHVELF